MCVRMLQEYTRASLGMPFGIISSHLAYMHDDCSISSSNSNSQ